MVFTSLIASLVMSQTPAKPTGFTFLSQAYVHRFSKAGLHEFTPKAQTDLKKFTDMVTVNQYKDVKDADALAARANAVLENYKANQAVVVRTSSVPRTTSKPAEHLIVVAFGRPTFIEMAFARFKLEKGVGVSVVYSHRIYGEKVEDKMKKWLQDNGQKVENALMAMPIPKV